MRTDYPSVITEDEATLRQVERQVRGRPTAVRVQALRLLQSGVAHSLDGCATLVGHSPRQVARWWALYRREGLDGLLREPTFPGKTSRLSPAALADLEAVMAEGTDRHPQGCPGLSGRAARHRLSQPQWRLGPTAQAPHQTQNGTTAPRPGRCGGTGGVRGRVSRRRWRAPRCSGCGPVTKGGAGCGWDCASAGARWCAPALVRPRPLRVVMAVCGGRTGDGTQLLPAVAPGDQGVVRVLPGALCPGDRRERVGLVLDGAGSHRADIRWPEQLVPLPLPPYSPELNPAEQVFRVLRPKLANRIFATLAELEETITTHLQPYWDQPALCSASPATPGGSPPSLLCHTLRERVYRYFVATFHERSYRSSG